MRRAGHDTIRDEVEHIDQVDIGRHATRFSQMMPVHGAMPAAPRGLFLPGDVSFVKAVDVIKLVGVVRPHRVNELGREESQPFADIVDVLPRRFQQQTFGDAGAFI